MPGKKSHFERLTDCAGRTTRRQEIDMPSLKYLILGMVVRLMALPGLAWSTGDRAAFEMEIGQISQGRSRPDSIAFLVT